MNIATKEMKVSRKFALSGVELGDGWNCGIERDASAAVRDSCHVLVSIGSGIQACDAATCVHRLADLILAGALDSVPPGNTWENCS